MTPHALPLPQHVNVDVGASCLARRGWLNSIGAAWVQDAAFGMVRMCCLQRNPVVQIGYCILTFGGFIVFIVLGYPRIPNAYMAAWHK